MYYNPTSDEGQYTYEIIDLKGNVYFFDTEKTLQKWVDKWEGINWDNRTGWTHITLYRTKVYWVREIRSHDWRPRASVISPREAAFWLLDLDCEILLGKKGVVRKNPISTGN
jgi:hypothetical protein